MCRGVTPNGTVLSRLLDGIAQCLTRGRFLPQPCFDQRRINEKQKKNCVTADMCSFIAVRSFNRKTRNC